METTQLMNSYVPRVLQLDSKQLDDEFSSLLFTKLSNALSYFENKLLVKLEPEINTLLKVFLHNFTLRNNRQTVGQALLDIKYDSKVSTKKLHLYSISVIFCSWLKMRQSSLVNVISNENLKNQIWNVVNYLEIYAQSLELVNLVVFLMRGFYPSLLERLFKLKMVPKTSDKRTVTYSYFTRELLWNGFSDLLTIILPLITFDQFHNFIKLLLPSQGNISVPEETTSISLKQIDLHCVCCKELSILPHIYGCKHLACYFCIFSSISSTGSFKCSLCGFEVFDSDSVIPLAKKFSTSD